MFDWLYNILNRKLQETKHDVIKKQWQIAKLEAKIRQAKEQQNND